MTKAQKKIAKEFIEEHDDLLSKFIEGKELGSYWFEYVQGHVYITIPCSKSLRAIVKSENPMLYIGDLKRYDKQKLLSMIS